MKAVTLELLQRRDGTDSLEEKAYRHSEITKYFLSRKPIALQKTPIDFSKGKKKMQISLQKKDLMVLTPGQALSCCHLVSNT